MHRAARPRVSVPSCVLLVVAGLAATSCTVSSSPEAPTREPAAAASLPEEISLRVLQYRSDEVNRELAIAVGNGGSRDAEVSSLQLVAPGFAPVEPVRFGALIPAGRRFDLRIPFGQARCGEATADGPVRLRIGLAGSGQVHEAQPEEGVELLRRIHDAECLAREVGRAVPMEWDDGWQRVGAGDTLAVRGVLRIGPVAPGSSVRVTGLQGTTLFGVDTDDLPLRLGSGRTGTLTVLFQPARCDPHAVAESKKGYDIGVRVYLAEDGSDDLQQALVTTVPDDRGQAVLEPALLERCGLS